MKTKTNQNLKGIAIDRRLVEKLETYSSIVIDFIAEGKPSTATAWNNDIKVAYNLLLNRYCLKHGIELNSISRKLLSISDLMRIYKYYRPN